MGYRYVTLDVFTDRPFGGNPLAVLPDARGLSDEQMRHIAREFNYSETTFVLPPDDPALTRKVRIFTPAYELPFAGHPNIGTAVALASLGELGDPDGLRADPAIVFEGGAGPVPITIRFEGDRPVAAELTAPVNGEVGDEVDSQQVAEAVSLSQEAITTAHHLPRIASAGIAFLCVELAGLDALAAARSAAVVAEEMQQALGVEGFFLYTRDTGEPGIDFRARMYAPAHGIPEDPATGSANACLAGLLASLDPTADGTLTWRVAQGVEMGRPSVIDLAVDKTGGTISAIRVAGGAVIVCRGEMDVPG